MNDILPSDTIWWQLLETKAKALLLSYGYQEIRTPVVEQTDLFRRSIGEVTDIVEKEMYTFDDRSGDSLTLRPEGTAGCARAAIQQSLLTRVQRLWYSGPMFRYERPQKGRQRQFFQIGAEVFGVASPEADAELIVLSARLWRQLGIADHVRLELNSIGSNAAREQFKQALVSWLQQHRQQLDDDSLRRLESNPLRILDSKNPDTQALLDQAPVLTDYLDQDSVADFAMLRNLLDAAGIRYRVNPRLVRGLDYYNKTVFEWITEDLGAQGTVCGGGRYDGLVAQLGGRETPAVGFSMGIERLILLMREFAPAATSPQAEIYAVAVGETARAEAFAQVEQLRDKFAGLSMLSPLGEGSFRSQMKKADKSGARLALIWGEDEVRDGTVTVKYLRDNAAEGANQKSVTTEGLAALLEDTLIEQ